MLQNRSLVILGLAILLGLAAVFIANSYLTGVEQQAEVVDDRKVRVAVARIPLEYGMPITADKIRFVDWPNSSLPEGTFPTTKNLIDPAAPRVALRPIEVNEPILQSKLSGEGGRASLSSVLRDDMRALAVRISDVAGVAGFVLPGDSVDVLLTRTPEATDGGTSAQITDILLQNVRVIAINQNANEKSDQPAVGKTATLEVTQINAQKLVLAQKIGSLSLALRNVEDQENTTVATVGTEDLRDGAFVGQHRGPTTYAGSGRQIYSVRRSGRRGVRRVKPRPRTRTVEIVRGTDAAKYEVKRHAGY